MVEKTTSIHAYDDLEDKLREEKKSLVIINDYLKKNNEITSLLITDIKARTALSLEELIAIQQLQEEKRNKMLDLTVSHPQLQLIDEKIMLLKRQLLVRIESMINKNNDELASLNFKRKGAQTELVGLPDYNNTISELLEKKAAIRLNLSNIDAKQAEYEIAVASVLSDFLVLQFPTRQQIVLVQTLY